MRDKIPDMQITLRPHLHNSIEFSKIDNRIYIGTNQCCRYHFNKNLLSKGISADISLEENRVDAPFGVQSYLWLPTIDGTAPSDHQLNLGVKHLTNLVNEKHKVYIHCKNGHGRAPTLVAAYYISLGHSVADAIKMVLSKRRGAHLNQKQKEALSAFAQTI